MISSERASALLLPYGGETIPAETEIFREMTRDAEKPEKQFKNGIRGISNGRTSDVVRLNPFDVEIEPDFNCRNWEDPENVEHVKHLARLMVRNGFDVAKAIEIRHDKTTGKIFLVDGECRLRAACYAIRYLGAQFKNIAATTTQIKLDAYQRGLKPLTSNDGKKPPILERARQIRYLLVNHGKTVKEVSLDIDVAVPTINNWLETYDAITAHPELFKAVVFHNISATTAYQLAKASNHNPEKVKEALTNALTSAAERAGLEGEEIDLEKLTKANTQDSTIEIMPPETGSVKRGKTRPKTEEQTETAIRPDPKKQVRIRRRDVDKATGQEKTDPTLPYRELFVASDGTPNFSADEPDRIGLCRITLTVTEKQLDELNKMLGIGNNTE